MSVPSPVAAPRLNPPLNDTKKPVPLPRQSITKKLVDDEQTTIKDRVRTFSSTSKQIKDELTDKVMFTKKVAIEGTRESLRRIKKRFTTSNAQEQCQSSGDVVEINGGVFKSASYSDVRGAGDVFGSIRFKSPISAPKDNEQIYNNVDRDEDTSSDESACHPPPQHPPPPPPDESVYDQPQSVASGNSGSPQTTLLVHTYNPSDYESIFLSSERSDDTNSSVDSNFRVLDSKVDLVRSNSWKMYDTVEIINDDDVDGVVVYEHVGDATTGPLPASFDKQNSLYENHVLLPTVSQPPAIPCRKPPRESVLVQFDPLRNADATNDIDILETLLEGDLYTNITDAVAYDSWSVSNESDNEDYLNPPTPPMRNDSLSPSSTEDGSSSASSASKTNWFVADTNANKPSFSRATETRGSKNWFKDQFNELKKKVPDSLTSSKSKEKCLERPPLESKGSVKQKGMLFKVTRGAYEDLFGEFNARWCVLECGSLICYSDYTCDTVKECYPLQSILSVQILVDQKYKMSDDAVHCFQLTISGKNRGGHLYGMKNLSERRVWLQKLADSLTCRFNAKITSDYTRIGWAYIREGVSGKWTGAWIILSKRNLYYAPNNSDVKCLDLRRARCIALQTQDDNCPKTNDKGPNLILDSQEGCLYLRMWTARETKSWCHILVTSAHNSGALLEQQQLTKDDVPVIVEKCINFVYAHGSMVEGIYRRSGSEVSVANILKHFRFDAWSFTLTIDKYSEHDVATALKRFFRDLPEPLLSSGNRQYLCQVALIHDNDEKVRMYRAVLEQLSPIAYRTVKRLLEHLHFVQSQCRRNLMTTDNLAAIWGPTLMHNEDNVDKNYSQKQILVVRQLIDLYRYIFPESSDDIKKEKLMLEVLERCANTQQSKPGLAKTSGDLRIWVYIGGKDGETVNVTIGPQKTAHELCCELHSRIKQYQVHELLLEEVVLSGNLIRPVHFTEKVLDVVLRWGYWDEPDRKDNCLIITTVQKYAQIINENANMAISNELKFADSKSKSFRNYVFDFSQAKLCYYKDKNCSVKLGEWNIEEIIWYLGFEPRRNPQSRCSVTFITKKLPPKRTKSAPWFGNIISGMDPSQRASWLGAMLRAEHSRGLAPPPIHVNLMA